MTKADCNSGKPHSAPQLPGPKRKQAEALAQNIKTMASKFGVERIGFLTLTVGESERHGWGFQKVHNRAEASRRFNSLLTNVIRQRYRCGVIVQERHKDGGIHFHLVVVCDADIRGAINFRAAFPPGGGRGDYRTANDALRGEWRFWRENAERYGFGRCQLQPVKSNGEAVGRYVGKYISKTWEARRPEDKGARLVRYFGSWSETGPKVGPPWSARHSLLTPRAMAWRSCMAQIQLASRLLGNEVNQSNIKEQWGPHWAWRMTRKMNEVQFFVKQRDGVLNARLRQGMSDHNEEAFAEWGERLPHIGDSKPGQWNHDYERERFLKEEEPLQSWAAWKFCREQSERAELEWDVAESLRDWQRAEACQHYQIHSGPETANDSSNRS